MLVLADTSIWIEHFKQKKTKIIQVLKNEIIIVHPWILGELLLGNLNRKSPHYSILESLTVAIKAKDEEVIYFIEKNKIENSGIGWVDAHLIVSSILSNSSFFTKDKKINKLLKEKFPELLYSVKASK